jgi:antitoxin (DNA-binding transcriptional repressor) of toxin-antitoxin stability system
MVTKTVDIHNTQMSLEDLLMLIRKGVEVILTDASVPLARMTPLTKSPKTRTPELHAGAIQTSDDFDEPFLEEARKPDDTLYVREAEELDSAKVQAIDSFLKKWKGALKGVDPDDAKHRYLQEKYR